MMSFFHYLQTLRVCLRRRNVFSESRVKRVTDTISHLINLFRKDKAAEPDDAECVNLERKPNRKMPRAPVTFFRDNAHNLPFWQQTPEVAASSVCDGYVPRLLLSLLLLQSAISLCHE